MTRDSFTGQYLSDRRRQPCVEFSQKACVDTHSHQSHTSKWRTDTLMATAVVLGTTPTLTPIAGGTAILDSNVISQPTKRSSEGTRFLESMTGYTLHIWPNGTVRGLRSSINTSKDYAILEFVTTFSMMTMAFPPKDVPKVRIKGVKSRLWLCMNSKGVLYAGNDSKSPDCEFYQEYKRQFSTLFSVLHHPVGNGGKYYVALNRRGKPRKRMTSVHKSSRFKTSNAEKTSLAPMLFTSRPIFSPKEPPYRRRSRHNIPDNPRHIKNRERSSERKLKNKSSLADVLTSIEEQLAKPLPSLHSDPNIFQNSMLIDLGANNPFLNIKSAEKIRHADRKRASKRGKKKKKSFYSRQQRTN